LFQTLVQSLLECNFSEFFSCKFLCQQNSFIANFCLSCCCKANNCQEALLLAKKLARKKLTEVALKKRLHKSLEQSDFLIGALGMLAAKKIGGALIQKGLSKIGNKKNKSQSDFLIGALGMLAAKKVGGALLKKGLSKIGSKKNKSQSDFLIGALGMLAAKKIGGALIQKGLSKIGNKKNKSQSDFLIGALGMLAAKKVGGALLKKGLSKIGSKKNKSQSDFLIGALGMLAAKKIGGALIQKGISKISSKKNKSQSDFLIGALGMLAAKKIGGALLKKGLSKIGSKKSKNQSQSDSENSNCGQAFERGSPLGTKTCTSIDGKPVVVETANAFLKMKAAASSAGVSLKINSGFRTQKEQEHLYNCYKTKKCNNGNLAAKPGYSNHQNGKALDIAVANPKVFDWMKKNASKFGFVRTVPSENWHWELRHTKCNAFVSYSCN